MYFITSNRGKFVEVEHELPGFQLQQYTLKYPEVQSDTLEAVVQFALSWLKTKMDSPFIIEDAGLFVETLGGFPGVYSAYVFQTLGNQGILQLLDLAACLENRLGRPSGAAAVRNRLLQRQREDDGVGRFHRAGRKIEKRPAIA